MNKNCIYTAIIGDYDTLYEPKIITKGWDYICFTDNKNIKSPFWKIVYLPKKRLSKEKYARHIKIRYWNYIGLKYDINIWHDANIQINCDLDYFLYGRGDMLYILQHPERFTALDESNFCITKKKDKANILHTQMVDYIADGFPDDGGLCGSGLMIRRDEIPIRVLMKIWWEQVKKYSHRDQLSFNYSVWKNKLNVPVNYIPFGALNKEFIKRPHKAAFENKVQTLKGELVNLLSYFLKENSLDRVTVTYDVSNDCFISYKL